LHKDLAQSAHEHPRGALPKRQQQSLIGVRAEQAINPPMAAHADGGRIGAGQ
jgi:hypothetical protein